MNKTDVSNESKKKSKKQKNPKNDKFVGQMSILFSFIILWCIFLSVWLITVAPLDEYNPSTNSPDGVGPPVDVETETDKWSGAVSGDYDKLPEVINGFGDVSKPITMEYYGEQAFTASTTVYVITTQKPGELGINKDATTDDGDGYFSWSVDINGNATEIGLINIDDVNNNWKMLYPEDYARLKQYIENKSYSWYTITYKTTDKKIVPKDECDQIVKGVFGMKLDPSRSYILYSGGYEFIPGGQ